MSFLARIYRSFPKNRVHARFLIVFVAVAGVFVVLAFSLRPFFRDVYENTTYALDPSAQRAYDYGERHFDATDPADYDVNRAEYFFNLAASQNPNIPYLYHELARISFLKGDFNTALSRIDFQISTQGEKTPNSYYVRGLIEGYMGDYNAAAADYEHFLQFQPKNWAALNDYAWVLLKANRYKDAYNATTRGLAFDPQNPWLLNSNAIALFEMGDLKDAKVQAQKAEDASKFVTTDMWMRAYPGNDPKIAEEGVQAFRNATQENMHSILSATSTHALQ